MKGQVDSLSPAPPVGSAGEQRPADAVEVGRILGAWGIKGGLKVKPFASDPQALFSSKRWFIEPGDSLRPGAANLPARAAGLLRVVQAREQGDCVVATVQDLDDRNAAEALAGWRVFIPRSSFPTPDSGEFYWVDLIGLAVVNREGVALGTVTGLLETGPHCVLKLARPAAEAAAEPGSDERLIPFVDAYVDRVDLAARLITVDWDPDY
jgi:16S rRNA processing protein RimM